MNFSLSLCLKRRGARAAFLVLNTLLGHCTLHEVKLYTLVHAPGTQVCESSALLGSCNSSISAVTTEYVDPAGSP